MKLPKILKKHQEQKFIGWMEKVNNIKKLHPNLEKP